MNTPKPSYFPSKSASWSTLAEWGVYVLLSAWMLLHTWLTWPDLYVDFGREIYNAWRVSEGELPFRDIAHYSGPLSMCFNGAFFRLAGVSMHHLFALNFAVWLGILWALWRILSHIASTGARMVALSVFILLMSFSRLTGNGNYNYLAPYSHELTHGLLLGLLALLVADRAWRGKDRSVRWLAATGVLLGLVLLTKPEVAVSAWAGVFAGLAARCRQAGAFRWREMATDAILLLAAATAIVATMVVILTLYMPLTTALAGILLPWQNLFNPQVTHLPYFKLCMGTDRIGLSLLHLLPMTALFGGGAAVLGWLDRRPGRARERAAAVVLIAAAAWVVCRFVHSSEFARALPVFAGAIAIASGWRLRHGNPTGSGSEHHAERLRWMLGVFSLALLLKIFLFARIWHYGFVLAAPAMLLVIASSLDDAPRRWFTSPSVRGLWRILVIGILLCFGSSEWKTGVGNLRQLTQSIGANGDRYRSDSNAGLLEAFMSHARQHLPPGSTLAVLPEGAMLNYLLRIPSPVPYSVLMPPEVMTFGEDAILNAYQSVPPDYVLLLHKDTSDFGFRFFGIHYAVSFRLWLQNDYEPVWNIGPPPLQGEAGGLLLLRREEGRNPAL